MQFYDKSSRHEFWKEMSLQLKYAEEQVQVTCSSQPATSLTVQLMYCTLCTYQEHCTVNTLPTYKY